MSSKYIRLNNLKVETFFYRTIIPFKLLMRQFLQYTLELPDLELQSRFYNA